MEGCFRPYIVPRSLDSGLVEFGVAKFASGFRVLDLAHVDEQHRTREHQADTGVYILCGEHLHPLHELSQSKPSVALTP